MTRKGKWYVGQRVRVIAAPALPEIVGKQATITALNAFGNARKTHEVSVLIDGVDARLYGTTRMDFATRYEGIRPIEPPRDPFERFMSRLTQPVPLVAPAARKARRIRST